MALRFLADHCVSNSTVQTLRKAKHEVFRLKDVLPVEFSDAIVLAKAQEIDAVLISLDGDFADIINLCLPRTPSDFLGRMQQCYKAFLRDYPSTEDRPACC